MWPRRHKTFRIKAVEAKTRVLGSFVCHCLLRQPLVARAQTVPTAKAAYRVLLLVYPSCLCRWSYCLSVLYPSSLLLSTSNYCFFLVVVFCFSINRLFACLITRSLCVILSIPYIVLTMVQSSLLHLEFDQMDHSTFDQRGRPTNRSISRPLSFSTPLSSSSSLLPTSTTPLSVSKPRAIPTSGHPSRHDYMQTTTMSTPAEKHRKAKSSCRHWPLSWSSSHRQTGPCCCCCCCRQQSQCYHRQPRSLRLKSKARAASPCTSMDSAPLTSSFFPDRSGQGSIRPTSTPIARRPPLFPQTSFDGVNNIKARSSAAGLVSIILPSSLPSDSCAVTSSSWTHSSVRSFSTSGGSSSYLSEVHTPSSDDDGDVGKEDEDQYGPNVTVVGSSCSTSSTEGTDIFWSLDSPLTNTTINTNISTIQIDNSRQLHPHHSSHSDIAEGTKDREAFANALNHRLQDVRFTSTRRRLSEDFVPSVRSSAIRPRPKSISVVRERVEIGNCPLTGRNSLPTLSMTIPMPTTKSTDLSTIQIEHSPLMAPPSESETRGSQNLFFLSILKLLSIPSASASTFASPSASSTWAAVQPKVPEPVPVPSQSTPHSRSIDPEESFHSSLPLLLLSPGPIAQKDVVRPGFPALKPYALVRFVVQLEMIRKGKIIKGKGHKSWDRILVWKQDRAHKHTGHSRLRWQLGRNSAA